MRSMIGRNVTLVLASALALAACGGSGSGAGDAVEDFLRALEWDDQERVQELLHSEVENFYVELRAEEISDRDGISRIEIVSEQAADLGFVNRFLSDTAIGTNQVQRVETRITFGDGSQLETTWFLAMLFERYQILEIPNFRSG